MTSEIHESSGNVFLDLGYSREDAEILHVSQSRISDLVRGKWEKFSLEMLIAGFWVFALSLSVMVACADDILR